VPTKDAGGGLQKNEGLRVRPVRRKNARAIDNRGGDEKNITRRKGKEQKAPGVGD